MKILSGNWDFANLFGDFDFKTTDEWLNRWKQQNIYHKLHGEKKDANSAAEDWSMANTD